MEDSEQVEHLPITRIKYSQTTLLQSLNLNLSPSLLLLKLKTNLMTHHQLLPRSQMNSNESVLS